jgi:hypothetical protein
MSSSLLGEFVRPAIVQIRRGSASNIIITWITFVAKYTFLVASALFVGAIVSPPVDLDNALSPIARDAISNNLPALARRLSNVSAPVW